jgi:hypothetical protein
VTDDPGAALPAPFDPAVAREVAAAHAVAPARLASLAAAHQAGVRRYTSVAGWLYELRRAFPRDPLVARRPEAFYLAVEPTVWPEFVTDVGADDDEAIALRALHDRTLRAVVDRPEDDRESMVVDRS